jgi:hypothetical protein
MNIKIEHNKLRLLSKAFMVILPMKHFPLHVGSKVTIDTDSYGKVGVAECTQLYSKSLMEVKTIESLIADGDTECTDRLLRQFRMFKADAVHVAVFHFVRRYDEAFQSMIEPETKNIGLNFSFQKQLFS